MKYYISFGQFHYHNIQGKIFDKDTIAVIDTISETDAEYEARSKAFALFGAKWGMMYSVMPKMEYFPKGLQEVE